MPRANKKSIKGIARSAIADDKRMRKVVKDIAAASLPGAPKTKKAFNVVTKDSFQNFVAQLGIGTGNLNSFNTYGFNPISRIHTLLEWIHRGSWVGGVAVDIVADDMTRGGVHIKGELKPEKAEEMQEQATLTGVWLAINDVIKWSRLYGGALGIILIDGQDPSTEFRIDTVGRDSFRGVLAVDRWMVEPDLTHLVTEYGPHLGLPSRYLVNATSPAFTGKYIHYSRCIRMEGIRLPWWQRLVENLWGLSVIERLYDRMTAFDAASTGAAQLVHKLHLRTYKLEGLRDIINQGGDAEAGLARYVDMMRKFQTIEGMTILDKEDEYEGKTGEGATSGVEPLLIHFGQQLAGALQIPLVRLFGQSPVGLNATGESDMRIYYDGILQQQVAHLLNGMTTIYRCIAKSRAITLPKGFGLGFNPLWQMTDKEKADTANVVTTAVTAAMESGAISQQTAMRELRQSGNVTGIYTNITDEDIEAAEVELPPGLPEEGDEGGEDEPPAKKKKKTVKDAESKKLVWECPSCGMGMYQGEINRNKIFAAYCKECGAPRPKTVKDNNVAALAWHHDLQVVIENPAGTERRGYGWTARMPADYGYVRRVEGADGDALDCYVGPAPQSPHVFIIDQRRLQDNEFDEHKVMLGYYSQDTAVEDYLLGHTDGSGAKRMITCTPATMDEFKEWMKTGDLKKPYRRV